MSGLDPIFFCSAGGFLWLKAEVCCTAAIGPLTGALPPLARRIGDLPPPEPVEACDSSATYPRVMR
jgi:hypothetical protein